MQAWSLPGIHSSVIYSIYYYYYSSCRVVIPRLRSPKSLASMVNDKGGSLYRIQFCTHLRRTSYFID